MPANPGTTNPGLLSRLADWRDDPAWGEFYTRYSPLVHARCRRFHRDDDAAEDACQRIWIGLSDRLLTFRYDPNGSFRAWLSRYCDSRLIDAFRERVPIREIAINDIFGADGPLAWCDNHDHDREEPTRQEQPRLLSLAVEIHERVRSQVHDDTWRAFWLVAVEDRTVREAAGTLGKTYAATFAAQKRVRQLLRDEGQKMLDRSAAIGPLVEEGS